MSSLTPIARTYTSSTGMGGFCRYPTRKWLIWRENFLTMTQQRLVSFKNPKGGLIVNNIKLCNFLAHIALFDLYMALLAHTWKEVDNTSDELWIK